MPRTTDISSHFLERLLTPGTYRVFRAKKYNRMQNYYQRSVQEYAVVTSNIYKKFNLNSYLDQQSKIFLRFEL